MPSLVKRGSNGTRVESFLDFKLLKVTVLQPFDPVIMKSSSFESPKPYLLAFDLKTA